MWVNGREITNFEFYRNLTKLPFVEEIWLFGSRARGDNQERADIDIAIFCPKADIRDWFTIMDIIENADTLLKIDCIRMEDLDDDSPLKKSIKRGIKIYERREN